MLIKHSRLSVIACASLLLISVDAIAVEFESGEWQTEVRIEFNGAIFPVPFTSKKCLSPQDPIPNTTANKANCKISDVSDSSDSIYWTLHCDDEKGTIHGVGGITFNEAGFTGSMDMEIRDDEGELENKHRTLMTGVRKGPCKE